jgi:hypothetical protein
MAAATTPTCYEAATAWSVTAPENLPSACAESLGLDPSNMSEACFLLCIVSVFVSALPVW